MCVLSVIMQSKCLVLKCNLNVWYYNAIWVFGIICNLSVLHYNAIWVFCIIMHLSVLLYNAMYMHSECFWAICAACPPTNLSMLQAQRIRRHNNGTSIREITQILTGDIFLYIHQRYFPQYSSRIFSLIFIKDTFLDIFLDIH